jgi:ribosomal protein S18 acetylase RimI-like enzyme
VKARRPVGAGWFEAGPRHRRAVLDRLLDREWAYVPITAHLRESASPLRGAPFNLYATRRDGAIADVVLRARHGLLLAAFADGLPAPGGSREPDERHGRELRSMVDAPGTLHSSMGLPSDVRRVERLLGLHPRVCVDHVLMTLDRDALDRDVLDRQVGPVERAAPGGLAMRRATVRDTERLLGLRVAYEFEEVILDPSRFSREGCRRRLRRSLRDELVYVAEHGGRPVATAATNTRGVQVDQIGGVFTSPDRRRTGLGTAVMLALLRDIFRHKKQACLFVKTGNVGALRLYERLGFEARGGYRIDYYR